MPLPNVTINIERNGLGGVALTVDGIVGICLTGEATDDLDLNKAYPIYTLDEAKALGILETGANADAYKQIKEFYDEAGTGRKLWIIVSNDATTIEDRVDKSKDVCPAKILAESAQGEIKVIGVTWVPPGNGYDATILDGLDSLVYGAVLKADALAKDFATQIMPFSVLLEGVGFTGTGSDLRDLLEMTSERAGIVLAATESNGQGAVGMVLGRLARIPVQRKISRVKDGALPTLYGYLTDGEPIESRLPDLGTMHDRGFIVLRKFPTRSGYYFNQDTTCAPVSNDLHTISNLRVIDKALVITYNTYVEEIDEEVKVNADGTLDAAMIAYLQAKIERAVGMNMVGEISAFTAYIDPKQNILSVPRLNVVLRITPVGYMSQIIVSLGFKNPALTA